MPGLSGKEVAQKLAALRPALKVLFMSGYAEDVIAHHGALEPGVAYIAKPFAPEGLAAKVREVLGPRENTRRILVVDDDSAVRTLLCVILRKAGYALAEAADGRQALAVVEAFKPHAVLMDLVMPEQEGIETIRMLSQRHAEVKIVAMSGAFAGPLLEGTVYLGAHAALAKPITQDALLETIRTLI
jgi:CheY-like chemotaxis protein